MNNQSWHRVARLLVAIATAIPCLIPAVCNADDKRAGLQGSSVKDMFFLDERLGWLTVCQKDACSLLRTDKTGRGWELVGKLPSGVSKVVFVNETEGWCLLDEPSGNGENQNIFVLRTEDGGRTWERETAIDQFAKRSWNTHEIAFADSRTGFFAAEGPVGSTLLLKTGDSGKTFQPVEEKTKSVQGARGLYVTKSGTVWAVGNAAVATSRDGGVTWVNARLPQTVSRYPGVTSLTSILVRENGSGFITGEETGQGGLLLSSRDPSGDWNLDLESKRTTRFTSVSFRDDTFGCAVGNSLFLTCTSDGGRHWTETQVLPREGPGSNYFEKIVLLSPGTIWVLGNEGRLYKSSDDGRSWNRESF